MVCLLIFAFYTNFISRANKNILVLSACLSIILIENLLYFKVETYPDLSLLIKGKCKKKKKL